MQLLPSQPLKRCKGSLRCLQDLARIKSRVTDLENQPRQVLQQQQQPLQQMPLQSMPAPAPNIIVNIPGVNMGGQHQQPQQQQHMAGSEASRSLPEDMGSKVGGWGVNSPHP